MGFTLLSQPPSQITPSASGGAFAGIGEFILLIIHAILLAVSLFYSWKSLSQTTPRQWLATAALALACGVFNVEPTLKVPQSPLPPLPLLAPLAIILAARWGVWPATLTGLAGGITGFVVRDYPLLWPLQQALFGSVVAWLTHNPYSDRPFVVLRRVEVASVLGAFLTWPRPFYLLPAFLPRYYVAAGWLAPSLEPMAILLAVALEGMALRLGKLFPKEILPRAPEPSPLARSITWRISAYLLGSLLAMSIVLVLILTPLTTSLALSRTLDESEHLVNSLAGAYQALNRALESAILSTGSALREMPREEFGKTLAVACPMAHPSAFCFVADAKGRVAASHPQPARLAPAEVNALANLPAQQGLVARTAAFEAEHKLCISLITPVDDEFFLVLRIPLSETSLATTMGEYENLYLLDEKGRVVLPPTTPVLARLPLNNLQNARKIRGGATPAFSVVRGQDGWLLTRRNLPGNWQFLRAVPHLAVTARVSEVLLPFSVALLLMVVSLALVAMALTANLARPIEELSQRALRLARGHIEEPVVLIRDDEIGKMSGALERIRLSFKARLEESLTILRLTQRAMLVPDLLKSLRTFLEGLGSLTQASGSCLAMVDRAGNVQHCIRLGKVWGETPGAALSPQSRLIAIRDRPLVVSVPREAPTILKEALKAHGVRAAIGIPLYAAGELKGVLWLTYQYPISPGPSEMSLITAITGQLSVIAENIRLLNEAERERLRLEAILKSTPDPILVVDELGRLAMVNPAAEEKLGIEAGKSVGLPIAAVLRDQPWQSILRQMAHADTSIKAEITTPQDRVYHVWASPLRMDGGETSEENPVSTGWVLVLRDITPFKEAEQARTEALSIVFHDLRSPLTLVYDYARTLQQARNLDREQKELLRKMMRAVEHLARLVNNFLDINRLEAGLVQIRPCWLRIIVEEAVEEIKPLAEEKGILIQTTLPQEPCPFFGDRDFVKRAIVNLLDNAVKYTPAPGRVEVSVEDSGPFWVVKVQDTGIGIPVSEQQRIFEKFYRVRTGEVINVRGSGLGLALVKSVAERHRGRVWVESEPGKGSAFFFAVPKAHRPDESKEDR